MISGSWNSEARLGIGMRRQAGDYINVNKSYFPAEFSLCQ